ncbi:MAG: hypothetical protein HUJ68_11935 [Clostridia bacterium]|nr:hypothetical protein [Clostridia bacterium]
MLENPEEKLATPFNVIYDRFLSKITDDLYLELTEEDTKADMRNILINAIPGFEFPRFPLFEYQVVEYINVDGNVQEGFFNSALTAEEIDILSELMVIEWLKRQIASIENTRMKYSGSDFKFTSQANHLDKLIKTKTTYETENRHRQRLYKRRRIDAEDNNNIKTNYHGLAGGVL